MGGIPVDRFVNTIPAYEDAKYWLGQGGSLLIPPEGARSGDGSMLPFKNGAAKLSIESGVPIVPIKIEGNFEIFPRTKRLPKIFGLEGKYPIKILIGTPIVPNGYDVERLTQKIRKEIENMAG